MVMAENLPFHGKLVGIEITPRIIFAQVLSESELICLQNAKEVFSMRYFDNVFIFILFYLTAFETTREESGIKVVFSNEF